MTTFRDMLGTRARRDIGNRKDLRGCGPCQQKMLAKMRAKTGGHVLLLEDPRHHVELMNQLVAAWESAGWKVSRSPWTALVNAWGIPALAEKFGKLDAVIRWEEHGGLFVHNTWRQAVDWCYANGVMPAMIDWGMLAHYKSVYLGWFRQDCQPDIYDVWDELPSAPDWTKADPEVVDWRHVADDAWSKAEALGPWPGTEPGYVLLWVQYSANGQRFRGWQSGDWCRRAAEVIRAAGKVPVFKLPPFVNAKMLMPDGEIAIAHTRKDCQNARLLRYAAHSASITTTATAECLLHGLPVVNCGDKFSWGLGVWADTDDPAGLAITPSTVDVAAQQKYLAYWIEHQHRREDAGEALRALLADWRGRYAAPPATLQPGAPQAPRIDLAARPPRTFYGVGRGMGNLLMAVPAMKAMASKSQGGAVETASGKYAATGYREWLGKQRFVRGGVPRAFPDMHGVDVVAGVAWDYYVPPEAPDGVRLPPGPACRGPHETIADAAPYRALGGDDLLPSGRMAVDAPLPDGLPVNYVVVAMDCCDKAGTHFPWNKRRWPHWERFCELWSARVPLVFLGTDRTEWAGKHGLDLTGKTSIEQAAAVVEQADAVVSIDGGLAHVAGSVRTPAVVLYGPTTSYREGPWYGGLTPVADGIRCRACFMDKEWQGCKDAKCMAAISPEQVVETLERVLRRAGRPLERELAFEQCQARIGYSGRRDIKPAQAREEMMMLWPLVRELHPRTVAEIGSKRGGWMYCMAPTFAPHARLVMIDIAPLPQNSKAVSELRAEEYDVSLVTADSHQQSTADALRASLGGGRPLDLLHIDGDHGAESFLRDWELYSPMVRSGGLVVVHDVFNAPEPVCAEVHKIVIKRYTPGLAEWQMFKVNRRRGNPLGIAVARVA